LRSVELVSLAFIDRYAQSSKREAENMAYLVPLADAMLLALLE
jgi:hypothetical protein